MEDKKQNQPAAFNQEEAKVYFEENKNNLINAVQSGPISNYEYALVQWFDRYYGFKQDLRELFSSWGLSRLQVDALMHNYDLMSSDEEHTTLAVIEPIDYEDRKLPQVTWAVKDLIPDGVSILAAPPKSYKSFFALQLAVSVCNGFDFLGFGTVQGDVIYFDLESNMRRPLNRINDMYSTLDIKGLHLVTADANVRRLYDGFEDDLKDLLLIYPNTRLVIIDVFQRILPIQSKDNLYSSDYANINSLNAIASMYSISILIVHHTRKQKDHGDPVNNISGSTGLSGAATSILQIVKKDRASATAHLLATGNDIAPKDIIIKFDESIFQWRNEGSAEHIALREFAESPEAKCLNSFMNNKNEWTGTVSELVSYGKSIGITLDAAAFGKILKFNQALLKRLGYVIEHSRTSSVRTIKIKKEFPV